MTVPLSVSNMALISFRQRAPSAATVIIVGIKKKETRKERVAIITRNGEEKKKKKKCNECILYVKQETNKKIKRRKQNRKKNLIRRPNRSCNDTEIAKENHTKDTSIRKLFSQLETFLMFFLRKLYIHGIPPTMQRRKLKNMGKKRDHDIRRILIALTVSLRQS